MNFVDRIHAIYDRHPPRQIHPLIGGTFASPSERDLRVMAVGVNSYAAEEKTSPSWIAGWFRDQTHRYQRGVWRDLKAVAEAVTQPPFRLASKSFCGMDSVFLTNAVKTYLPEALGKRADQLSGADYDRHLDQWHDELDLMAEEDVLPHIIAIVGDPFWARACDSFRREGSFKRLATEGYDWCKGSCRHFLNRVRLKAPNGKHDLLLVRLRHPAGRAATGSPTWLVEQAEFRAMAT